MPGTARPMRRMEKITGRSDDMMIIRGVNVFPTQIEEQLLKISDLSPHFQIELIKDGRLDKMIIKTERLSSFDQGEKLYNDVASKLKDVIKESVGISVEVSVGDKGSIPRSQGKAIRVIDNR